MVIVVVVVVVAAAGAVAALLVVGVVDEVSDARGCLHVRSGLGCADLATGTAGAGGYTPGGLPGTNGEQRRREIKRQP